MRDKHRECVRCARELMGTRGNEHIHGTTRETKGAPPEVYCNIYAWFRQNKSIRPRFSFLFSLFLISCFLFFHPPAYAPVHTACRRTSLHSQMLCSDVYSHSGTAPSQDFLIFCFTPFCFSCCFFVDLCPTVC